MGAFVFPWALRWILDAMAVYGSETHSAVSAPVQFGSIPAFQTHQDSEDGKGWGWESYPPVDGDYSGSYWQLLVIDANSRQEKLLGISSNIW